MLGATGCDVVTTGSGGRTDGLALPSECGCAGRPTGGGLEAIVEAAGVAESPLLPFLFAVATAMPELPPAELRIGADPAAGRTCDVSGAWGLTFSDLDIFC